MMLANLAGPACLFNHAVEAYKNNYIAYNDDRENMKVGITNLLHIQDNAEDAFRNFFQYLNQGFMHSNGHPMNKEAYVDALDIKNVILVGDVDIVVNKILYQYDLYKHDRTMLQIDLGGMPFEEVKRMINIIAKEIAPRVKAEIKKRKMEDK